MLVVLAKDDSARSIGLNRQRQRHGVLLQRMLTCNAIGPHFIARGKPMQNGFIKTFNGQMRKELLNETLFFDLDDARPKLAALVRECNGQRPHLALSYSTPAVYAANFTSTNDRLRNPNQLRRSSVAPRAPHGAISAETLNGAG